MLRRSSVHTRLVATLAMLAVFVVGFPESQANAQVEDTGEIPAFSGDGFANFRTFCEFSHAAYDDPIVHPGEPGAAHLHFFFGNTRADAFSTPETLRARGSSTCQGGRSNRSAYWIPATFMADGRPILPDGNNIYYKHLNDEPEASVQQLPADLRMIAGNADGSAEDAQYDVVHWQCGTSVGERSDTIPVCAQGDDLIMEVDFPPCWDGVNTDSPDHQSHMSYAEFTNDGDLLCPESHPVAVPQIIMLFSWELRDTSSAGWYLSSDMGRPGGVTLHADWMNGWRPSILSTWHRECIQEGRDCIAGQLGDGRVLEPTMPFGSRELPLPHGSHDNPELYCNGRLATIVGTSDDDDLVGTDGDDVIVGLDGDDTIDGRGGNDFICGGDGSDDLRGSEGADEIRGGKGRDAIDGGPGDDFLHGGNSADSIVGALGNDGIHGGGGDDVITEFGDANLILGQGGDDTIIGGWWIDIIYGGSGDDVITGTGGPDRIYGGKGVDACTNAPRIRRCE